jgi:hypothetical protein
MDASYVPVEVTQNLPTGSRSSKNTTIQTDISQNATQRRFFFSIL